MSLSTHTSGLGLWGLLMFVALGLEVVFASLAFVYTRRLLRLRTLPLGDDLNGYQKALRKLRKNEPMSRDEWNLAERIIDIRRSPIAYAVPAAFMTLGIFYIFGSLEYLHGHTPSERTFLGVIPMFTSTNLIIQMRKSARLKKRLDRATVVEPDEPSPAALAPFG
ncbi:hypothetical protein [Mycolicibacterium rhodesiae]|uniref:Uncharacterized protein n=1 Tax=Mycolicibacterium rhodesiae TaxID=36814 RepID=A0A1X0ILN9_MYCRH|nr:hypothetical protein [Mycolicibacterium rhodesiae]MCV7347055.1 hypothetical protein [Mycolicibacterium rhodesiae]ORB48277.1 hypothetical protein BST42_25645 [Mycolicibacterium rhodesiae]